MGDDKLTDAFNGVLIISLGRGGSCGVGSSRGSGSLPFSYSDSEELGVDGLAWISTDDCRNRTFLTGRSTLAYSGSPMVGHRLLFPQPDSNGRLVCTGSQALCKKKQKATSGTATSGLPTRTAAYCAIGSLSARRRMWK